MVLTERIYNILAASSKITIPEIWAGSAASTVVSKNGLLTFFPLPSSGADFHDGTSITPYQFDIWAEDMYEAEGYKEELIMTLLGYADTVDGVALIFIMDSDAGGVQEDDTKIWHYSVTFNVKYARR